MRLYVLITSTVALLAAMLNNRGGNCGDRGQKRALEVDDVVEPCVNAIYSWVLADWQTNEGGAAWHATQGAQPCDNLIERLLRGDYTGLKNELPSINPTAFSAPKAVCTSKSRMLFEMRGGVIGEHCGGAMDGDTTMCVGALAHRQRLPVPDGSLVAARGVERSRQDVLDGPQLDAPGV